MDTMDSQTPRRGSRVMVTGCAGFIGSHVTRQLLDRGDEVVGVDELNDAYDPRLKEWRLAQLRGAKGFAFHRADIADRDAMARLFETEGFEAVVNLAARAGVRQSLQDPWVYLRTNAEGTLALLDLCRRHDVRRLVLASTSSLYGAHNPRPFREDAETDHPLSPYAASKKAAEAMCASYAHLYGMDTPVLRYFTVYGPAGRPDMSVFRFCRWIAEGEPVQLTGDGSQERDFTFVDDIARGTLAALDARGLRGFEVVNLGGDKPHRMNEVIATLEGLLGKKARIAPQPPHAADVPATWADIGKARRLLGWEPRVALQEGLAKTVAWHTAERAWAGRLEMGA